MTEQEDTGFVDFGAEYNDTQEPELAPTAQYRVRIESSSVDKKEGEDAPDNINFRITILGGNYAAMFHRVYLPKPGDDAEKKKGKLLFAKRFCHLFNIPVYDGKFNRNDAVGKEATANVNLRSYTKNDGSEGKSNNLVLPQLPQGMK